LTELRFERRCSGEDMVVCCFYARLHIDLVGGGPWELVLFCLLRVKVRDTDTDMDSRKRVLMNALAHAATLRDLSQRASESLRRLKVRRAIRSSETSGILDCHRQD
jgi:hypothetical protein